MPKKYEEFAAQVTGCNTLFQNEVKRKADELNKIDADWRYSPKGKQEKKEAIFDELKKTADNISGVVREACKRFMAEYGIKLPDDKKDHSIDIQNALQIIDMLGFNLDEKNLNNILNPLKGSFRNMKTVIDLIRTKDQTSSVAHYAPGVITLIDEASALNTSVYDYLDFVGNIQEIIDNPNGYGFERESISNGSITYIRDVIPYPIMACPDWMKQAGEMYAVLENQFSDIFNAHIPTDQEMIEEIMK